MNRVGTKREYYVVPIDVCFELVGLIRKHWRGLSGGDTVWRQVETFFGEILIELRRGKSAGRISAKFHNTLAEVIVAIAREIAQPKIVLTGGCFQNRYLLERSVLRLSQAGFRPYWHQRVPTNDGGIALGQVVAAARAGRRVVKTEGCEVQ